MDLGGVTRKIVIEDKYGQRYMLKFAKEKLGIKVYDYITEYIACKMAKELGYNVQEVYLGHYKGEECVAVKMFNSIPTTYEGLGSSTLEGEDMEYNLEGLLSLQINERFAITKSQYIQWVFDVFTLDMMLSNFDRHENNWGFIDTSAGYVPSPLYDLGASLYPKFVTERTDKLTDNEIKHIIQFRTRCSILYEGKRKNYFELLDLLKDNEILINSIKRILVGYSRANFGQIYKDVREYNPIFNRHLEFIQRMLDIKVDLLRRYLNEV